MPRQKSNSIPQHGNDSQNVADTAMGAVLSMLPLHAEEGTRREVVAECGLVERVAEQGIAKDTAAALICALRRQFDALALLDPVELQRGCWSFVSFPASLLGRSWLTTLATPGQAVLPPEYWEQGDHRPDDVKEEQRMLLHRIETERVRRYPEAQPIRVVHVAWALIRWRDKFLLHIREDKSRPGEKGYGMVGGRFNLSDLPPAIQSRTDILQELFRLDSTVVAQHITATLQRELEEETGMLKDKHYSCEPFGQPLPPYKEVNGAGNRHAYSAYIFHLFRIKLTSSGETHLLSKVAEEGRLTWFSAAEIDAPQRADGAAAYVDALRGACGKGLEETLSGVSDSWASEPAFTGESMMLDLPETPDAAFKFGKPGKEKEIRSTSALTQQEWELLMLLGWHIRAFRMQMKPEAGIRLLDNGWIDAPGFVPIVRGLLNKIPDALLGLLETREDRFVSLSVAPDLLFFPADLFGYRILGSDRAGGCIRLQRRELETQWGRLDGHDTERNINGNTVRVLRSLEKSVDPNPGCTDDWRRSLREQLADWVSSVGLRRLWTTQGKVPRLVAGLN